MSGRMPHCAKAAVSEDCRANRIGCATRVSFRRSPSSESCSASRQRPAGQRREQSVDGLEMLAENLVVGQGGAAHADPLGAIAGIDEAEFRRGRRRGAGGAVGDRAGFGEIAQRRGLRGRLGERQQPERWPPRSRCQAKPAAISAPSRPASIRSAACAGCRRPAPAREKADSISRRGAGGSAAILCGWSDGFGLADHHMGVGAAETEGGNPRQPGALLAAAPRCRGRSPG